MSQKKFIKLTDTVQGEYTYEELLNKLDKYIYKKVNKFSNLKISSEELYQLSRIGLWKAYKNFDSKRKINFITFATRCIENEILMCNRSFSKSMCLSVLDGEKYETIIGNIPEEEEDEMEIILKEELNQIISTLSEKDKELLFCGNKIGGYTQQYLGQKYGITQNYVSRLRNRVLKKVRTQLHEKLEEYNKI